MECSLSHLHMAKLKFAISKAGICYSQDPWYVYALFARFLGVGRRKFLVVSMLASSTSKFFCCLRWRSMALLTSLSEVVMQALLMMKLLHSQDITQHMLHLLLKGMRKAKDRCYLLHIVWMTLHDLYNLFLMDIVPESISASYNLIAFLDR